MKNDGRYELVSGHRRKLACELAGLDVMPCIVRDLTRDEAIIAMVDSNLQREVILPSEKARSYKMKLDAMKRQAGRPSKNNSAPLEPNLIGRRSNEEMAEQVGESASQIKRYVRLTELVPPMLEMVDTGMLTMRPAVELSYLSQEHQQALLSAIESEDRTPSHAQAMKLRKFFEEGSLSSDVILSVMQEDKPAKPEHFKFPRERINRFFPAETPATEIEETIIRALELWWDQNKT
jgi:ParB family chromosome partitioning protein